MASTSDVAKQSIVQPGSPLPLLVICDHQTAGRGQPGKSWFASDKSLTFTWCVEEAEVCESNRSILPMIAGICICSALTSIGIPDAKLKWPNDVLLGNQKVCGILVEKVVGESRNVFVVGIGINVNQDNDDLAGMQIDSRFPPGSILASSNHSIHPQLLLENILEKLHKHVGAPLDLEQHCKEQISFLGQPITFERPNGDLIEGLLLGIDQNGHIRIEIDSEIKTFNSGQIR